MRKNEKEKIGALLSAEPTREELAFEEEVKKLESVIGCEEESLEEPLLLSLKKRLPWLVVLLFLGLLVSGVIGMFETVISAFPVIVFFQSMILDMSGNVGTQSLAVTLRNLPDNPTREDKRRQWRCVRKELLLGLMNGLLIGVLSFLVVVLYLTFTRQEVFDGAGYVLQDAVFIGAIVSVSMLISILFSGVLGAVFPILLTRLHIDPAVASGPFITTLNDIIAVVVYYSLTFLTLVRL